MYPFAKYDRWMHWAQNTVERYRINDQKNVYLKKYPEDGNLTEEALQNTLCQRGEELENILGYMKTFNANDTSSNVCFYKRRKELEALIQQESIYSTWFTFSAADNHWLDLNKVI